MPVSRPAAPGGGRLGRDRRLLESQPYAFSADLTDAYYVVRAAGELDIAAVPQLRNAVRAARRCAGRIVVDLRDVSFVDTYALRALTALQVDRSDGGSFHVVPGDSIQRVLDLTGARAALPWISSEQLGG